MYDSDEDDNEIDKDKLYETLKEEFERITSEDKGANKDFRIQFSVFQREFNIDNKVEYYLNSTESDSCRDEGIYDVKVEYADTMDVKFRSWKGNYLEFDYDYSVPDLSEYEDYHHLDDPPRSDTRNIYVAELYPGFVPRNYRGEVWTRGGCLGWNWVEI